MDEVFGLPVGRINTLPKDESDSAWFGRHPLGGLQVGESLPFENYILYLSKQVGGVLHLQFLKRVEPRDPVDVLTRKPRSIEDMFETREFRLQDGCWVRVK